MQVVSGLGDSLEEGMATLSNILAWRILWTEDPGGLESMGSQRVGHTREHTHAPCLYLSSHSGQRLFLP